MVNNACKVIPLQEQEMNLLPLGTVLWTLAVVQTGS